MDSNAAARSKPREPLTDLVKDTLDDLVDVISAQLRMVRVELAADARAAGRNVTRVATFVPVIMTGYLFILAGLSLWLGRWMGPAAAFAAVGVVNAVAGAIGLLAALRRVREVKVLDRVATQVSETVTQVGARLNGHAQNRSKV